MSISKWQTRWMQNMGDILICIAEQNGWSTQAPLSDMFERFSLLGEEGTNDDNDEEEEEKEEEEEETPIMAPDYEHIFRPDRSSKKSVAIHDPSQYSSTQTSGRKVMVLQMT